MNTINNCTRYIKDQKENKISIFNILRDIKNKDKKAGITKKINRFCKKHIFRVVLKN